MALAQEANMFTFNAAISVCVRVATVAVGEALLHQGSNMFTFNAAISALVRVATVAGG